MALHRAKQRRLPVAFVGAGFPPIPSLTAEAKSYAERMFVYPQSGRAVSSWPASEALVQAQQAAGRLHGSRWCRRGSSHTRRGTLILHSGVRATRLGVEDRRRITFADTKNARLLVEADLHASFFEGRVGRRTRTGRRTAHVSAMAEHSETARNSGRRVARAAWA